MEDFVVQFLPKWRKKKKNNGMQLTVRIAQDVVATHEEVRKRQQHKITNLPTHSEFEMEKCRDDDDVTMLYSNEVENGDAVDCDVLGLTLVV